MRRGIVLTCVVMVCGGATASAHSRATVPLAPGIHGDTAPPQGLSPASPGSSGRVDPEPCGPATFTDDTLHEIAPEQPKIKVIELVPADRDPDDALRVSVTRIIAGIFDHVAASAGDLRTLRFDLGTACGARSVDLTTVRLPRPAQEYQDQCDLRTFDEVRAALPRPVGLRNLIMFTSHFDCGLILGTAEMPKDDRPGPENAANRGGYIAMAYQADLNTALHEIGHTLGAVQPSAPHSDTQEHCYDNDDVMCYGYTAALPQSPLRPCIADPLVFDCGNDDYFSADPAPGSYLDTHWNTYDSVFMCDMPKCVPEPPPPPPSSPAAVQAPQALAAPPGSKPVAKRKKCRRGYKRSRAGRCVRVRRKRR